ncbi:cob(I)yrinic acid a,c-diamide adenosyltransferase [Reinekea sp.]|jgi:cob(I)alamin adenosyltransferase|uniref:cob(I)yrinic acid a,c-diamide adenosyltransferase n=1 Tax=Reinekea sp. TaxID=1970455 RepID=UPI00398A225F
MSDASDQDKKNQKHKESMQKQKESIDSTIAKADEERGVLIFLTGNGKGKSSSGFGMVMRALGYGQKVAVVQFIKGQQLSGEELYIRDKLSDEVTFYQMGTGFTWDTQDRSADIAAAEATWKVAEKALTDPSYDLVLLDEITYMIGYKYLNEETILNTLKNRPKNMSVVVTGRGGGSGLKEIADTVSEVKDIKHAYNSGVKARQGVDY